VSKKIIFEVDDPLAERTHCENTARMLLASFVARLTGISSRQVRYANPHTIEQASKIAVSNREPNKKKNLTRVFIAGLTIRLSSNHIPPVEPATKIEFRAN